MAKACPSLVVQFEKSKSSTLCECDKSSRSKPSLEKRHNKNVPSSITDVDTSEIGLPQINNSTASLGWKKHQPPKGRDCTYNGIKPIEFVFQCQSNINETCAILPLLE